MTTVTIDEAARAAVHVPWTGHRNDKHVVLNGHDFWVKAIQLVPKSDGGYQARSFEDRNGKPKLSHMLRGRPDDDYFYEFDIKADGKLTDLKQSIDRGGWTTILTNIIGPAGTILKTLTNLPIDKLTDAQMKKLIEEWGRKAGRSIDGYWEASALAIALKIAGVAAASVQKKS